MMDRRKGLYIKPSPVSAINLRSSLDYEAKTFYSILNQDVKCIIKL